MSLIKVRKIATLDGEDKRDGKNSIAADAKFKKGDRVWVPAKQKRGVIRGVSATGNQYEVEFMGGGGAYVNEEELEFLQALGNSRAADASAAKFHE